MKHCLSTAIVLCALLCLSGCSAGGSSGSTPVAPVEKTADGFTGAIGDFYGSWKSTTCDREPDIAAADRCELRLDVTVPGGSMIGFALQDKWLGQSEKMSFRYAGNVISAYDGWAQGAIGSRALRVEFDLSAFKTPETINIFEMQLTGQNEATIRLKRIYPGNEPDTIEWTSTLMRVSR